MAALPRPVVAGQLAAHAHVDRPGDVAAEVFLMAVAGAQRRPPHVQDLEGVLRRRGLASHEAGRRLGPRIGRQAGRHRAVTALPGGQDPHVDEDGRLGC
ncbi:hypothetical protein ACFFX0_00505 [Citricoccus parietis]|uniref:Uncharacterized protein n=1 Tax=Citricoccus parietis TaxID=592307 RepID=A0ABV5FSV0_9MICC